MQRKIILAVIFGLLSLSIVTGALAQGALFTLVSSSPANLSTVTVPTQQILLTFNTGVTAAGVVVTGPGGIVAGVLASGATTQIIFTATGNLPDGSYTVDFSGVRSVLGGAPNPPTTITFTVNAAPPTLVTSDPINGASNVSLTPAITLTFDKAMNAGSSIVTMSGGAGAVPGTLTPFGSTALRFTPSQPLAYETQYTVDFSRAVDFLTRTPSGLTAITFTTMANPLPPILVSSDPAASASDVQVGAVISLSFNKTMDAASSVITLRSNLETVTGALTGVGSTLLLTPNQPLRSSTRYAVDFSQARDSQGLTPTGLTSVAFSTAAGALLGNVTPQVVSLSAGEQAGVTYMFDNQSSLPISLTSSQAQFFVSGALVATVNAPLVVSVPANSVGTAATTAMISQQIQDAARTLGTDEVALMRSFQPSGGGSPVSVSLLIRIRGSLAAPATVREIQLDVPPDGKMVGQFQDIRAHAFIRGNGTGAVVGTWFVDGRPTETFQTNMVGGFTQEVSTRMTLPTQDLGRHEVQLRIVRPAPVESNIHEFVVVPGSRGSQRVYMVSPGMTSAFYPDAPRVTYRWAPMPGASGYEIAFAPDIAALGFERNGEMIRSALGQQVWTNAMESAGRLSLLATVSSDTQVWKPTKEQYAKIFSGTGGVRYWAVRAIYPSEKHGDPTTTSRPGRAQLLPNPSELKLSVPIVGAAVQDARPVFQWVPGPDGSIYEFKILLGGKTVYTALTSKINCSPDLTSIPIGSDAAVWHVAAVMDNMGVVATSEYRSIVLTSPQVTSTATSNSRPMQAASLLATASGFALLPGAAAQITITPSDGSTVDTQQPSISATYPAAKPETVVLTLNGVDVTGLASVNPTSLSLDPPGVFSEGQHTVKVTLTTAEGAPLEAKSVFTIAAPAPATETPEGGPAAEAVAPIMESHPLALEFNWNWSGDTNEFSSDSFDIDLNLRGQQQWMWGDGSYAGINAQLSRSPDDNFDLANFLTQVGVSKDRYRAMLGDVGFPESELTAEGLMSRSFNVSANTSAMRLSASHTLGGLIQRTSTGRAPDVFLMSAETSGFTKQQGFKLMYVDSKDDLSDTSGFAGPTHSKVLSLRGQTPLGRTGLSLRAELANSDSNLVTAFGSQANHGSAVTTSIDGAIVGFTVSANYRRTSQDYASTASSTLTNNISGLTFNLARPWGQYASVSAVYTTLDNAGSSPASSLTSKSLNCTLTRPHLPSLNLSLGRNEATSRALVAGGTPGGNEENLVSATLNHGTKTWNGYLMYSKSNFEDFFDFINPAIDTPNDRKSNTWSGGLLLNASKVLRLRGDWGANRMNRWFRPLLATEPIIGIDGSHNSRLQLEYLPNSQISATMAWSKSTFGDALGTLSSDATEMNVRLNYFLKVAPGGAGFVLTGEYRRFDFGGTMPGSDGNELRLLINDNRLVSF